MTVLRAARLFDGETFTKDAVVAIEGGRFVEPVSNGEIVDLGDVTVAAPGAATSSSSWRWPAR